MKKLAFVATAILLSSGTSAAPPVAPPPFNVGQVVHSAVAGTVIRGWSVTHSGCDPTFTICFNTFRRGAVFYVAKTVPVNGRPGQPVLAERIVAMNRYVAKPGEATDWDCYIDEQTPPLAFVSRDRRSVRAVIFDRANNLVEVVRQLRGNNWCTTGDE